MDVIFVYWRFLFQQAIDEEFVMRRLVFILQAISLLLVYGQIMAQNETGCVYKPEIDGKAPLRPQLETRDYKVMPRQYSLKKYCPHPKSQSDYNTC